MASDHEKAAQWRNDLIPNVVDQLARERPDAMYGEWVTDSSVVAITYVQLSNIVNALSRWLLDQLGSPGHYGKRPEMLAHIGPNDVRYSALVLAAARTGHVVRMSLYTLLPYCLRRFNRSFM